MTADKGVTGNDSSQVNDAEIEEASGGGNPFSALKTTSRQLRFSPLRPVREASIASEETQSIASIASKASTAERSTSTGKKIGMAGLAFLGTGVAVGSAVAIDNSLNSTSDDVEANLSKKNED